MNATGDTLPTASRVSDPGMRALYRLENRWQAFARRQAGEITASSRGGGSDTEPTRRQ